jgi:hypothetical protein
MPHSLLLSVLRNFAGPGITALAGIGFQLAGIESEWLGYGLIGLAVVWALVLLAMSVQWPLVVRWRGFRREAKPVESATPSSRPRRGRVKGPPLSAMLKDAGEDLKASAAQSGGQEALRQGLLTELHTGKRIRGQVGSALAFGSEQALSDWEARVSYLLEGAGRGDLVDRFEAPEGKTMLATALSGALMPQVRLRQRLDVKLARLSKMIRDLGSA